MVFSGLGVALVTPFIQGEINYKKIGELIDFQISNKTDAIIILGTTGESLCLSNAEKKEIIDFSVEYVKKRVPLIVGTGSASTKATIELSLYAQAKGVDGLMICTPYYNKPSEWGLYSHYFEIAKNVDLPIILYNVPSRTGVNLPIEIIIKLARLEEIVGIKEASGDLLKIGEIITQTKEDFYVYSGNDDQLLDVLKLGGRGVISVTANLVSNRIAEVISLFKQGKQEEANLEFEKLRNLNQILFIETNPVPIKTAMNYLGFAVGEVRLPLVSLNQKNLKTLKQCLENYFPNGLVQ